MTTAVHVDSLTKRYGELTAVADVSFGADAGAVFGLLGPNGAGKSTTIGCISGLLVPTAGRVTVQVDRAVEVIQFEHAFFSVRVNGILQP